MRILKPAALCLAAALFLSGCGAGEFIKNPFAGRGEKVVGKDISPEDITEFYYTYDTSTYPPDYQRYRFYTEDGKYFFHHEKRQGDHWPLTDEDITLSGSFELDREQWAEFFALLEGGTVKKRSESAESGDAGPWLYLYWKGDGSLYQEFSFLSRDKEVSFEEFCVELARAE